MKKVLVFHYIPTPHRNYQFNLMNDFYKEHGIIFKVAFLSGTDKNRDWSTFDMRFDYVIMKNIAFRFGTKDLYTFFINPGIYRYLSKEKPDKIICFGWDNLNCYISNIWARLNNKQFIIWSGSTDNEKSWRRTLFNPLVKYIVRHSHHCVGDGTRHRDYLIKLGANPERVSIFFYQIDVDYFQNKVKSFSLDDRYQFRSQLGIKTSRLILFNGQLIERKGIFELLDAFKAISIIDNDISLLILGRGKEKNAMLEKIKNEQILNIYFADFVQYDTVYKYFCISDMLAIPSREEAWGLVINEAMACGLPVITTTKAGASPDLIEDGKTGFAVQPNCPKCIVNAIQNIYKYKLHLDNGSLDKVKSFDMKSMIKEAEYLRFT